MEIDAEIDKLFSKKFPISYFEKQNKFENGNMNFSLYEIIIQARPIDGKIKTDKTIAYAEISHITIQSESNIIIDLSEKNCILTITVDDPLYVIKCIFIAFRLFFPCEDVFSFFSIKNEPKLPLDKVIQEVKDMNIYPQSKCNNFTFGVKFFAKYKYLPENDEIIWDIDTIYANKESTLFIFKDFDHLKPKFLMPVLGAMCYNTYFTELSLSFVDMTPYEKLLERVFKTNKKFKKLYFDSCNLKLSLCAVIGSGLESQRNLISLDLSNNEGMGEKGVDYFLPFLKKYSKNLEVLKMSKCNLSSVSLSKIADAFTYNIKGTENNFIALRVIDFSNNLLRDNYKEIFFDFLAKCTHLEDLNLANMNCSIEMIGNSLLQGPVTTLKYVDLSENISPFSSQSCTKWSKLFKDAKSLTRINFSNFKSLHCSITDGLMLGLEDNATLSLTGVEVIISNSNFNSDIFLKFSDFIYKAKSVTHLDISSNAIGIEFQTFLKSLPEFKSLKCLNVSNNFGGLKPKEQQLLLSQLTSALQLESVNLQELYLSNCNFGTMVSILISELDSFFSLRVLDISSNNIGNVVARTLGRMLTIDKHIKEIMMDNNNISKEIYEEILDGLIGNYTLTVFHVPFVDLVKYPPKMVISIIEKINKHHMKVNKIYQGVSFEDIKAMAFTCIMNQTSENIDKCKTTLQESCNRLKVISTNDEVLKDEITKCLKLSMENIKSMEASKNLMTKLSCIYKNNDDTSLITEFRIKKVMEKVSNEVSTLLNEYMHEIVAEMMNEMGTSLPYLLGNNEKLKLELKENCQKVIEIPPEYLKKLFSRFIENNLVKKVYEAQSNVTNALCDKVTDHIIIEMNCCDIEANKLISCLKMVSQPAKIMEERLSLESIEKPVIRCNDDKKVERDKLMSVRTSRLSHLAASKARPLSKALKTTEKEQGNQMQPVKPMKPLREKPNHLKYQKINNSTNVESSETTESLDSPLESMKPTAPSRIKRLKPVSEGTTRKFGSEESLTESSTHSNILENKNNITRDIKLKIVKITNNSFSSQDLMDISPQFKSPLKSDNKISPRIMNTSSMEDNSSNQDSPMENIDFITSLKSRPKHTKNVKPKLLSTSPSLTENPVVNDIWQHFHNFTELEAEKTQKISNKKKSFFSLSKNKFNNKSKTKAIDFNNLGSENISSSESDIEQNYSKNKRK